MTKKVTIGDIVKYSPDQDRDDHGRFDSGSGVSADQHEENQHRLNDLRAQRHLRPHVERNVDESTPHGGFGYFSHEHKTDKGEYISHKHDESTHPQLMSHP